MPKKAPETKCDKRRLIGLDLFAGAGGMSLGFTQAGFNVVAAVEIDPIHAETHSRNFPKCVTIQEDICNLTGEAIRKKANIEHENIDVLFGGPPCQGFSMIGKRSGDDPRSQLFLQFSRLVEELKPSYFVVENVDGLLKGKALNILDQFIDDITKAGYSTVETLNVLNACDFGIPQNRKRLFVLGFLKDLNPPLYPSPDSASKEVAVWDAIRDMPVVEEYEYLLTSDVYRGDLGAPSEYSSKLRNESDAPGNLMINGHINEEGLSGCLRTAHSNEVVKRFRDTPPGTIEPVSRFYRLKSDGISNTLRAGTNCFYGSYTAPRPIYRNTSTLHYSA